MAGHQGTRGDAPCPGSAEEGDYQRSCGWDDLSRFCTCSRLS